MKGAIMKKVKVYVVICSYTTDGVVIDIELDVMFEKLQLSYNDNSVDDIVMWNVNMCQRVKYDVKLKLLSEDDIHNNKRYFGPYYYKEAPLSISNYMNSLHDKILMRMPADEFYQKFRNYGNNYIKQCRKEAK